MAKACVTHLEDGEILALDGTRVDCNSENISLAAVGKKKDGSYGPQINVSLVINVKNGSPLCYRAYAGNISDISTLDDLRKMWTDIGISEKSPLILMDRGYPNQEEFVNLDRDGYRFLIGAKTVSYTHLDVYKRQRSRRSLRASLWTLNSIAISSFPLAQRRFVLPS